MSFEQNLQRGKVAETKIANWLRVRHKYAVLPVYEIAEGQNKGPQLFTPNDALIAPDMLAICPDKTKWIEAKQKTVFSWYRIGQRWVTGIDRKYYHDYIRIAGESPWPVWLLFYHTHSVTSEGDGRCPVGLFGNDIIVLQDSIDHESDRWGRSGMVYWARESLIKLATCEQVESAQTGLAA